MAKITEKDGVLHVQSGCNQDYYKAAQRNAKEMITRLAVLQEISKDNQKALTQMEIGKVYYLEYHSINDNNQNEPPEKALVHIGKIIGTRRLSLHVVAGEDWVVEVPVSADDITRSTISSWRIAHITFVRPATKLDVPLFIGGKYLSKSLETFMKKG